MSKVHDVVVRVTCDWDLTAREVLDFVEHRLQEQRDPEWGTGRGGVNYAKASVVAIIEGQG